MKLSVLGGLGVADFLRAHWQKRPLLVRQALPGFGGLLSPRELMRLATREEVESRLVIRDGRRWHVESGPFAARRLSRLPSRQWTLLVHGLDLHLPAAHELMMRFSFVPLARLDDVMVSYAAPGGGVGPHFDSYDVFLLQGPGRRRWRISAQTDLSLVENAPLKVLKRFRSEQTWVLEPGDLLYLPPRYAHEGTALEECMTYSIGFRAPSHTELATQFLVYLQDRIHMPGMYADPDLRPQPRPARIPAAMVRQFARVLDGIRWGPREVEDFAGVYLSEPKPTVVFSPPARPLGRKAFARQAAHRGVVLDIKTRMLWGRRAVYINGEAVPLERAPRQQLARLGDRRRLPPGTRLDPVTLDVLYQWYRAGYLDLGAPKSAPSPPK
ncbi:cupin domain-containing protein [Pelomicrobium methylotrophicum]|uniref:Cupin domain-containing protein n=1 Tax=Pelomicrobium methylotrophicum TaxID=2602750 RepID=A0A5C7EVH4_9PROT|nr:cupin domain-containing protein [Pelomicrobium methylotrophicum]TXF12347.1 cupin domain-containing protein [Pelomicrobium methylotrophicum]